MAQHQSALKSVRKTVTRTAANTSRMSRIRTYRRSAEEAIIAGKKKDAQAAFQRVQPELMRGVTKGLLHKNTVSRTLARLSSRIKALKA